MGPDFFGALLFATLEERRPLAKFMFERMLGKATLPEVFNRTNVRDFVTKQFETKHYRKLSLHLSR